jgi:hypothetical protein
MTDEVFAEYQAIADVVREDFKVSRAELIANPNECDGEKFLNRGSIEEPDVYLLLQGARKAHAETSSDLPVTYEFEGTGDGNSEPFTARVDDILVISSNGGPIEVAIGSSEDSRRLYLRPEGGGSTIYETIIPISGQIRILVTSIETVSWQISVRRSE